MSNQIRLLSLYVALFVSSAASAQMLELKPRGTFAANVVAGSEIVAHDPQTQRLFITNGALNRLDVVDIQNVDAPTLSFSIDISPFGGFVNSVAVSRGLVAAAIANATPTTPGVIAVFSSNGTLRRIFSAGVLPDHVSFSPDGNYLLSANEGEPVGDPTLPSFVDPRGSITVIDLSAGLDKASARQIDFSAFDSRAQELRASGVRIFSGRLPSRDFEPEYIAVAADNRSAWVSLQETNAFAVLDLSSASVVDIVPAGLKDYSRGLARVSVADFPELPILGTTPAGQNLRLGGFSGLWFEGVEGPTGKLRFAAIPDRGPNGEPSNVDADPELERPFALPNYQPRVVRFLFDPQTRQIELGASLLLTRNDGSPMTGLPNIAGVDEEPVDLFGTPLTYDPMGADLEALVIMPNGDYWMADEYRPAIYRFDATGKLQARYVPAGTAALAGAAVGTFGSETLPAEYSKRRANRGFEGLAFDSDAGILYAFIQTPLANPNLAASNSSKVIRMVGINPVSGAVVAEYVYPIDKAVLREQNTDKIGDAVYTGNGNFYIVERDDSIQRSGKKLLFQFNLTGATNLRAGASPLLPGLTLEQHSLEQLAQTGIRRIEKIKVANLPSLGYFQGDKLEGLASLGDGQLALLNDNDFGIAAQPLPTPPNGSVPLAIAPKPIQLGIVRFDLPNALDVSDRDGTGGTASINMANWPIYGMHMPDSMAAFSVTGRQFYVSAGEGDDRGEVARIGSTAFALDSAVFPNAAALRTNAQLGRLNASTIDGNLDNDPEFERLQVLGSRSVNIWDQFGNLVYDSGEILERVTSVPGRFNSDHEANQSVDTRSDNKGPEPEAIAVGSTPEGRTYAFVGLERVGGIAAFDVTDPYATRFASYTNRRDFLSVINLATNPAAAGDLGPEGIIFISAANSPTGAPMLAVANEISGTTTLYSVVESLFRNGFE